MEALLQRESRLRPGMPSMGSDPAGTVLMMLAFLIAFVSGQLGMRAFAADKPATATSSRLNSAEIATRAFYDGMNQYLATGDDAFLRLLAPGFQDHRPLDAAPGSRTNLVERLDAMRRSAAVPTFTIETMRDLGNLMEVRISTGLPATFDIAGLLVQMPVAPISTEYLQLERTAIVARWSQDDRIPEIDRAIETSTSIGPASAFEIVIEHVTLQPGAELDLTGGASSGILMEEGTLTYSEGGSSQRISGGDDQWLNPAGPAHISNLGAAPVLFWLAQIAVVTPIPDIILGEISTQTHSGVSLERYSWATQFDLSADLDRVHLQLARATLPPGTQIGAHQSGFGNQLAVIDGVVRPDIESGVALHCRQTGYASSMRNPELLTAGEGMAALSDAHVSYRVDGSAPATVLLLTIVPE